MSLSPIRDNQREACPQLGIALSLPPTPPSRKRNCLSAANSRPTTRARYVVFHPDLQTFSASQLMKTPPRSELTLNILPRLLLMIDPPVAAEGKQLPKRGREDDDDKRMDGLWIGDGGLEVEEQPQREANIPIYSSNGRLGPPLSLSLSPVPVSPPPLSFSPFGG